ncbi:CBD9-like protein [Trichodelitschia bisporula]|uniref:CBD9-like protein n=1 Tax=Trichodelitschia bisporula TaxID=703511 RepID=A0A6G1I4X6_9PEZI|nr:CBD9-like protein [Trichodelitschia bisporula]
MIGSIMLLAATLFATPLLAQGLAKPYTEPKTGIQFQSYAPVGEPPSKGGFEIGLAFPQDLSGDDYIGHIVGSRPNGRGYTGISHIGGMTKGLLLIAWADGQTVKTSFRYAIDYLPPAPYKGAAKLTTLASTVNATHFTLTYHCAHCFSWSFDGVPGNQSLSSEALLLGFAQGAQTPTGAAGTLAFHDNGQGIFPVEPKLAANPKYSEWAKKASSAPAVAPKSPAPKAPAAAPKAPAPAQSTSANLAAVTKAGLPAPKIPIPTSTASTASAAPAPTAGGVVNAGTSAGVQAGPAEYPAVFGGGGVKMPPRLRWGRGRGWGRAKETEAED